jgi:hypothetical protein
VKENCIPSSIVVHVRLMLASHSPSSPRLARALRPHLHRSIRVMMSRCRPPTDAPLDTVEERDVIQGKEDELTRVTLNYRTWPGRRDTRRCSIARLRPN